MPGINLLLNELPENNEVKLSSDDSNLNFYILIKIDAIESNSSIELVAIGIGHDVSRYYKKAVTIMDVDQLGEVLLNQLSNIFSINN